MKLLAGFESFGPPVKDFRSWSQCCHLDEASVVQRGQHCSVSSIQTMFLECYVISTFCAVDRVDLVWDTC